MTPRRLLRGFKAATRRMVSDWPVVAAALATVVLSATLLSAGPIYGEAITISAFARAMENAPPEQSGLSISASPPSGDFEGADRLVEDTVAAAMGSAEGRVTAIARASIKEIISDAEDRDLAEIWHVEGIQELATLTAGRWPSEEGPAEVALPAAVAEALGVAPGDTLHLSARGSGPATYDLPVVGVFTVDDVDDIAWFQDPMIIEGSITSGGRVVYGPFIASRDTVVSRLDSDELRVTWRIAPDYNTLQVDDITRFSGAMSRLADTLNARKADAPGIEAPEVINFSLLSRIDERLATIDRSLTVTSSTILAVILQLSLLALYALVLTSRLVVDTRTTETALARSRGASPTQVAVPAFFEGILLAVPAILLGPPLAARLVALLSGFGPLASIDLTIEPRPNLTAYALAAVAAGVSVLALLWPAFRSARAFPDQQKKTRRVSGRGATQKLGIDIALIALLAVAIWQLGELGPRVSATVRGRLGVDPLLVIAPALGLAAGVILALRIIPRLARLSERVVSARVPAVPALALWQVARRPDRYSRSALLLMTAVALGVFASSFSASWTTSQMDQASHRVGADVKFLARRTADSLTDYELRNTLEEIPGVTAAIPVLQIRGPLARGLQGRFLLTDAGALTDVVRPRADVAGDIERLAEEMAAARTSLPSIPLPGEPTALRMVWEATELQDPTTPDTPPQPCPEVVEFPTCFHGSVAVVIRDGDGAIHRMQAGHVYGGHDPVTLEVDLRGMDGRAPTYPLSLSVIELTTDAGRPLPEGNYSSSISAIVSVLSLEAVDGDGSTTALELAPSEVSVGAHLPETSDIFTPPTARLEAGEGLTFAVSPGLSFRRFTGSPTDVTVAVMPGSSRIPLSFPIVVTEAGGDELVEGARLNLRALGLGQATGVIIGRLPTFPGVEPEPPLVVLVDLPTFQALSYVPGQPIVEAEEYWVAAEDPDEVAAQIGQPPISGGAIVNRQRVTEELISDPIALGTVGAFAIGFTSAAVFAVIGFAISAFVSARERQVEFSLLHALGLKRGQLGRWLLLEQAALVVVSLVLGLGVGLGIGEFLLPLVTLNQDGSQAVPELLVIHEWGSIWGFQMALLITLGVVLGTLVATVARRGVASSLRFGDEP